LSSIIRKNTGGEEEKMPIEQMKEILHKSFKNPDQTMAPPNTKVEIIKLGDYTLPNIPFSPAGDGPKILSRL
jgi:hypothetical protein